MRRAPAHGIGVIVTSQNPKVLDDRLLTDAGDWFVGCPQSNADYSAPVSKVDTGSSSGASVETRCYFAAATHSARADRELAGFAVGEASSGVVEARDPGLQRRSVAAHAARDATANAASGS